MATLVVLCSLAPVLEKLITVSSCSLIMFFRRHPSPYLNTLICFVDNFVGLPPSRAHRFGGPLLCILFLLLFFYIYPDPLAQPNHPYREVLLGCLLNFFSGGNRVFSLQAHPPLAFLGFSVPPQCSLKEILLLPCPLP